MSPVSAAPSSASTSLSRARSLIPPAPPLSRYLSSRADDAVAAKIAVKVADLYSCVPPPSSEPSSETPPESAAEAETETSAETSETVAAALSTAAKKRGRDGDAVSQQLALVTKSPAAAASTAITLKGKAAFTAPTPQWHAPWKLKAVVSGHLGWVRSIAVDPLNQFVVTGSSDRTIKIWDLPKLCTADQGALKLTLTGHINAVRGLAVSDRHPYMFSAGEDKMVKCWDLETNKIIRDYHGHLSGVFTLALHPTLDIVSSGER